MASSYKRYIPVQWIRIISRAMTFPGVTILGCRPWESCRAHSTFSPPRVGAGAWAPALPRASPAPRPPPGRGPPRATPPPSGLGRRRRAGLPGRRSRPRPRRPGGGTSVPAPRAAQGATSHALPGPCPPEEGSTLLLDQVGDPHQVRSFP